MLVEPSLVIDQHEFYTIEEYACTASGKKKESANFHNGVADAQRQRSIDGPGHRPQGQRQEAEVAQD